MESATWVERICYAGTSINWPAWSAIGTILAALATLAAVWTALRASEREHKRTIELRDAEWDRQDKAARLRAAILAQTFRRELLHASLPLREIRDSLVVIMQSPDRTAPHNAAMALVGMHWGEAHLHMLQRTAGDLAGFDDQQAVLMMDAISAWSAATRSIPLELARGPIELVEELVAQRVLDIEDTLAIFDELRSRLEPTAGYIGFTDERSVEEVAREAGFRRQKIVEDFIEVREKRFIELQAAFANARAAAPAPGQSGTDRDGASTA